MYLDLDGTFQISINRYPSVPLCSFNSTVLFYSVQVEHTFGWIDGLADYEQKPCWCMEVPCFERICKQIEIEIERASYLIGEWL